MRGASALGGHAARAPRSGRRRRACRGWYQLYGMQLACGRLQGWCARAACRCQSVKYVAFLLCLPSLPPSPWRRILTRYLRALLPCSTCSQRSPDQASENCLPCRGWNPNCSWLDEDPRLPPAMLPLCYKAFLGRGHGNSSRELRQHAITFVQPARHPQIEREVACTGTNL